jgi:hypothetical protein
VLKCLYELFCEHVFLKNLPEIQRITLLVIDGDRKGEAIDHVMVKSIVDV